MTSKMMRIAGRGYDNTAKSISTDNKGNLNVNVIGKSITIENITVGSGEIVEVARFFKDGYTEFLITANIDGNDLSKDVEFIFQGHREKDAPDTPLNNVDFKPYSNIVCQINDGGLGFVYNDINALIGRTPTTTWNTGVNRCKYMENYLSIRGQVWRILAKNTGDGDRLISKVEVAMR